MDAGSPSTARRWEAQHLGLGGCSLAIALASRLDEACSIVVVRSLSEAACFRELLCFFDLLDFDADCSHLPPPASRELLPLSGLPPLPPRPPRSHGSRCKLSMEARPGSGLAMPPRARNNRVLEPSVELHRLHDLPRRRAG